MYMICVYILSKYQRPRTNSKRAKKKDSTTLCSEIYNTQYTATPPNSPARVFPPNTQSQLTGLHSKLQKSVKQKECSPTKVLCKRSSFSFPYKKAQIEEFPISLKNNLEKVLRKDLKLSKLHHHEFINLCDDGLNNFQSIIAVLLTKIRIKYGRGILA